MELDSLFDSYLEGKMSEADRVLFENLLSESSEYQAQLQAYQLRRSNMERLATQGKTVKNWLVPAAIAVVIVVAGYFLISMLSMSPGEKIYAKYYKPYPNQVPPSAYGEERHDVASEAFQAYNKGDFQRAAELLEQIQGSPDYVLLYLGVCHLELNRPEKAIPLFSRIQSGSSLAPKEVASWFEALGYFKLNMIDKGKASLQVTASNPNPFQDEAKNILETLK